MLLCEDPPFLDLLEAVRRGDLEQVSTLVENFGVDVNRVDKYDYSPLILASLCGHMPVVKYLLEHGAVLERDTFDGARCLYGALNDEIRNLLLKYDASTAVDLMQPFAAHLSSLFRKTALLDCHDVVFDGRYEAHRFLLGARSAHLRGVLAKKASGGVGSEANIRIGEGEKDALEYLLRWLYVDARDTGLSQGEMAQLLLLADRLGLEDIADFYLNPKDLPRRDLRQQQSRRAQDDMERWVDEEVLGKAFEVSAPVGECSELAREAFKRVENSPADCLLAIPSPGGALVYPVSRAMLIRSEYYLTLFTSPFAEAQTSLPVTTLEVDRPVAEIVLRFLYTDKAEIPRELAVQVVETASFLLMDKDRSLKSLAAIALTSDEDELPEGTDIYAILRVAWLTDTPRLEQFAARWIAHHFDACIFSTDFADAVLESAGRIRDRQETDTVELVDDIRFYLQDRFGIYFGLESAERQREMRGKEIENDVFLPGGLTQYELDYNETLRKLDDVLGGLNLDV